MTKEENIFPGTSIFFKVLAMYGKVMGCFLGRYSSGKMQKEDKK